MSSNQPTIEISSPATTTRHAPTSEDHWRELVDRQVQALKFGSVHITVHEGRLVQIETSVRVRFDKPQ